MPTRMVHMVTDAVEPVRLARFWAAALGWEMTAGEAVNVLPAGYSYPDPVAQLLVVLPVREPKQAKNAVGGPSGCRSRPAARPGRGTRRCRPG
jgi:hypothetical protein